MILPIGSFSKRRRKMLKLLHDRRWTVNHKRPGHSTRFCRQRAISAACDAPNLIAIPYRPRRAHHVNAQTPSPANTEQSGPSRPSTEIEEDSRSPSDVVAISSPEQADLPTSSQPLGALSKYSYVNSRQYEWSGARHGRGSHAEGPR